MIEPYDKMEKKLIEKYFLGKCTPKEEKLVKAWLETMKEDFYDLSIIEEDWYKFDIENEQNKEWDPNPTLSRLRQEINKEKSSKHIHLKQSYPKEDISKNKTKVSAIAATLTLFLTVGIFFYWKTSIQEQDSLASNAIETPLVTKSTKSGERSILKLSDGTVVKLNANSSITFKKQFENDKRQVKLSGEAFFEVAHDSLRPFEVLTNDLKKTVLGTTFNVKAYPNQSETMVSLLEGKVEVSDMENRAEERNSVVLSPLQELLYNRQNAEMRTKPLDKDKIAWKYGILIFKSATIDEIAATLESWYGVKVLYPKNRYNSLRFTGKFDNKTLRHVMEGIRLTAHFKFELEGKKLKIE